MKKKFLLSTVALAFLIGCGGSGGGSNSSFTTQPSTSASASNSNLFPKTAKVAEPTQDNTEEVAKYIVSNNPKENTSILLSVNSDNTVNIDTLLLKLTPNLNNLPINEVINEKDECEDGGYYTVNGNADDKGGEVTLTYYQCKEDGFTFNGSFHVIGSNYNSTCDEPTHYEYNVLNDFTIIYNSNKIILSKNSNFTVDETLNDGCDYSKLHYYNVNEVGSYNGDKRGLKNGDYIIDINPSTYSLTYNQGNLYISNLEKYATIDKTIVPLTFDYYGITKGDLRVKFDKGSAEIKVENGKLKGYLDKDGDGKVDEVFDINN
jgi:hypothetical protein